jgi:hypothetical protein
MLAAPIIRVTGLIMKAASISEMSVNFYQTTQHDIPQDSHLHDVTSLLSTFLPYLHCTLAAASRDGEASEACMLNILGVFRGKYRNRLYDNSV